MKLNEAISKALFFRLKNSLIREPSSTQDEKDLTTGLLKQSTKQNKNTSYFNLGKYTVKIKTEL